MGVHGSTSPAQFTSSGQHSDEGALSTSARRSYHGQMLRETLLETSNLLGTLGSFLWVKPQQPSTGWLDGHRTGLAPSACPHGAFIPLLKMPRSCFAPDGNHNSPICLHWKQDQIPGELMTDPRSVGILLNEGPHLRSPSWKGNFHLHLVPPHSWLQQPWTQVPAMLRLEGTSFSPSSSALQGALKRCGRI